MSDDLRGKVFLVTGATEGIGKAATVAFVRRGADVTIVGRNKEKTERVLEELRALGGAGKLALLLGDLSKIADVRAVAVAFRENHDRLDVLVNNAGAVFTTRQLSADGWEMTFALNHLAYFVLTVELEELLKKTPGARVVSTSSEAHRGGRLRDLDEVAKRTSGKAGFGAYSDSKLANILFTRELARRLGPSVYVSCFHPGFVRSGFGHNNGSGWSMVIGAASSLFGRTPEKGAETLIWLATSQDALSANGEYWKDMKVAKSTKYAKDDALAKRLWDFSAKITS
ncbi:SDR family oxidoreductase [soil metagenome]